MKTNSRNKQTAGLNNGNEVEALSSPKKTNRSKEDKTNKSSAEVSPRDIKKHQFETSEIKKQGDVSSSEDQVANSGRKSLKRHSQESSPSSYLDSNQPKRLKLTTETISNPTPTEDKSRLQRFDQQDIRKILHAGARAKDPEHDMIQSETSADETLKVDQALPIMAMEVKATPQRPLAIKSPRSFSSPTPQCAHKTICNVSEAVLSAPQQVAGVHVDVTRKETDGNATSSSSSSSKPSNRPKRVSLAYLQRTRAQRRAIARARTQRLEILLEEEKERERMMTLQHLDEKERQKYIRMIETERQKKEAARRREVKRVKNRESVEKSRVRELVLENEVENEGDALRWENHRMASFLEYVKKERLVKQVKKEVSLLVRKEKRITDKES